jgi:S-adenosylmethionine:diacylglycerol 3-amino-3-carboxypropyl transferase
VIFWRGLPFGQVREDPAVELYALELLPRVSRAVVIASAGCTGFALAMSRKAHWTLLDQNPNQIALCQLKRRMLLELPLDEVVHALDHDARPACRKLGLEFEAGLQGLNHCGHADRMIARLSRLYRKKSERFFQLDDPQEQERVFRQSWDTWFWHLGWRLTQAVLCLVYKRPVPNFMPGLVRRAMCARPAATNLYLWQAFLQRYPPGRLPAYLRLLSKPALYSLELVQSEAGTWLDGQRDLDFMGFSNILEVTPDDQAGRFCQKIARAGRSGALVVLRSILPRTFRTSALPCSSSRTSARSSPAASAAPPSSTGSRSIRVGVRARPGMLRSS